MKSSDLPKEIPEKPVGWTRELSMHLSFGRGKGFGSYIIRDENGKIMPIGYQYDTRKDGQTGFFLIGTEKNSPVMSWNNLRSVWARFLEKRAAKQSGGARHEDND